MVSQSALKHGATVGYLACQYCPRYQGGSFQIIGSAILFTPQEDIARHGSLNLCKKISVLCKKTNSYTALSTESHEVWTAGYLPEADNPAECMNRQPQSYFIICFYYNSFAFFKQIRTLRCY